MQKIALLGLGTMGSGMAANWLKKGFPLAVFNRTRERAEPFAAIGARIAMTPAEAAEDADIILAMVADDEASREVWAGDDGALMSARAGAIAIESSTVSPAWIRTLSTYADAHGCPFLDAPVGGSKGAAAAGQLTMFVGGEAAALAEARPALEAISKAISHVGPVGAGATWKLINNMMLAVHLVALSEALTMADKAGLDLKAASERILAGMSASPVVQVKMPRMVERNFDSPDFALKHMAKDLKYAVALAAKLGLPLHALATTEGVFRRAEESGLGELDFAAVLKAVEAG